MPAADGGEDLKFENSDLREERDTGTVAGSRAANNGTLRESRRGVRDRKSHLRERRGAAAQFVDSDAGERPAPGAPRELGEMLIRA